MEGRLFLIVILFFLILFPIASAAHFIVGRVNDALDTTSADGHTVVLWNPANGMSDNLTDIVGPTGNSGTNNTYMIDCELLSAPCIIGDEMRVKVIDNGDTYVSEEVSSNVTGSGFDLMPNITLNSPPNISLENPLDKSNVSTTSNISCSATDLDGNLANVTLYGNWSGGWHANETKSAFGNESSASFTKNLSEGSYKWNCLVSDNLSVTFMNPSNFTFTLDKTPPVISSVYVNETDICQNPYLVRVNCTATDSFLGIDTVIIKIEKPSGTQNYTAKILTGDTYYTDVLLDEQGSFGFSCIVNDTAGNVANLSGSNATIYSASADLKVLSEDIGFSNANPIENENITLSSLIFNNGCSDSGDFLFGFYKGDPESSGVQIGSNQTLSIAARSNLSTNTTWLAEIGPLNLFVFADVGHAISEENETDNKANKTLEVNAWQEFYGIISFDRLLSSNASEKISLWINESATTGNIFATDTEAEISWGLLQAIGRNSTNGSTLDDFSDMDSILNMSNFNDSISNVFTSDGNTPLLIMNFTVSNKFIEDVPIVNSTNNSNFITGILWDTSDDLNGEFSEVDSEDLVFVTKISGGAIGKYGAYDYEIRIPARLREQDSAESQQVYFYYELD